MSGVPLHKMEVKIGAPKLFDGTRLRVTSLGTNLMCIARGEEDL